MKMNKHQLCLHTGLRPDAVDKLVDRFSGCCRTALASIVQTLATKGGGYDSSKAPDHIWERKDRLSDPFHCAAINEILKETYQLVHNLDEERRRT